VTRFDLNVVGVVESMGSKSMNKDTEREVMDDVEKEVSDKDHQSAAMSEDGNITISQDESSKSKCGGDDEGGKTGAGKRVRRPPAAWNATSQEPRGAKKGLDRKAGISADALGDARRVPWLDRNQKAFKQGRWRREPFPLRQ